MKLILKTFLLGIFSFTILVLLAHLPGGQVNAEFDITGYCQPGEELPSAIANLGNFEGSNKDTAESTSKIILSGYDSTHCVSPNLFGDIKINSISLNGNGDVEYNYCNTFNGLVTGADVDDRFVDFCCPSSYPVAFEASLKTAGEDKCCPRGTEEIIFDTVPKCQLGTGERVLPESETNLLKGATLGFTQATKRYYCPEDHCTVQSKDGQDAIITNETTKPGSTQYASVPADIKCLEPGERAFGNFNGAGNICFKNELHTAQEFALIGPQVACEKLEDANQEKNCLECVNKNQLNQGRYVYTALGCVDTERNGFITRVFQLGLGTIPLIAVGRIMYAAVLMQSQDPAKIQEGRDMVVSAMVALVVLALAIPILQFVGINILGLFTGGFLG